VGCPGFERIYYYFSLRKVVLLMCTFGITILLDITGSVNNVLNYDFSSSKMT